MLKAQVADLVGKQLALVVVPTQIETSACPRKLPKLIVPIFTGKFAEYLSHK